MMDHTVQAPQVSAQAKGDFWQITGQTATWLQAVQCEARCLKHNHSHGDENKEIESIRKSLSTLETGGLLLGIPVGLGDQEEQRRQLVHLPLGSKHSSDSNVRHVGHSTFDCDGGLRERPFTLRCHGCCLR